MRVLRKSDIRLAMKEGKRYSKKSLYLKEASNTTANVNPTQANGGTSNIATDLADAKTDMPTASMYEVDSNELNNNTKDDAVPVAVTSTTTADQAKEIRTRMNSPEGKAIEAQGKSMKFQIPNQNKLKLMASRKVNDRLAQLRENSVAFSKKEMDDFFENTIMTKKIYIKEEQTMNLSGDKKNLLPPFLFSLVKSHVTSLGDNPAFPPIENFDYHILKKRLKQLNVILAANDLDGLNETELLNELSRLISEIKKIETPIRPQLQMVCENAINRLFAFPNEIVNVKCELVDKVKPEVKSRITPEERGEDSYAFEDLNDINFSNQAIAKRRLINSLIQGGAHTLVNEVDAYSADIHKLNPNLMGMYHKAMVINEYLTFVKKEKISDKKPNQGAHVQVAIGTNGDKTEIKSQAIIFPLLLMETIRGFLELFSVHGLPGDINKAKYIVSQADFLSAEPFDIRFGTVLWDMILPQTSPIESKVLPYYFMKLCKLSNEKFNKVMQEMFAETNRSERLKQRLLQYAKEKQEYSGFQNRINARKLDKAQLNDSYFTASELDSFENEEFDDETLNESLTLITESRAEDNARKVIKQWDPELTHEEVEDAINNVRSLHPLLKNGAIKKFIYGFCRFYFIDGVTYDDDDTKNANVILRYLARNLDVAQKLPAGLQQWENLKDFIKDNIQAAVNFFVQNGKGNFQQRHYTIVKIPSFEKAKQYNRYLYEENQWCVTWSKENYDGYTENDTNIFYFCLVDGFENIEPEVTPNAPYDDYGLSMIALNINPQGELKESTTRWNHSNGGTDDSFTESEIEALMGVNFKETFKPRSEEDMSIEVLDTYDNGNEIVKIGRKYFLRDGETKQNLNKAPWDGLWHYSNHEYGYFAIAKGERYDSIINSNGEITCSFTTINVGDGNNNDNIIIATNEHNDDFIVDVNGNPKSEVFDSIEDFAYGYGIAWGKNGMVTYINSEGQLIYNGMRWFEDVSPFRTNFGLVYDSEEDYGKSLVTQDGKLIENGHFWFDRVVKWSIPIFEMDGNNSYSFLALVERDHQQYAVRPDGIVANKKAPMRGIHALCDGARHMYGIDTNGVTGIFDFDGNLIEQKRKY